MLERLFYPKSVAVIGASHNPEKVGHAILNNLIKHNFQGNIYPINPKENSMLGLKVYPDINKVPEPVDMAVFAVPPAAIIQIIRESGHNIGSAIVISAGFKESGGKGVEFEKELKSLAEEKEIRIFGPNCVGLINTDSNLNASFAGGMPAKGNISFFSQSGALCTAILDWAIKEGIGFSKFISLGNKMDLTEIEMLEYLRDDPNTRVILGYLEGVTHGEEFIKVAADVTQVKPVIITKSGRTGAGSRAASSHTGTLAGSEHAYNAAFNQAGIIRAESMEALFDFALAFAYQSIPSGSNLAIVTNAGGPGILAADSIERSKVQMAQFSRETIESLKMFLPPSAALLNPVDIIGDAREDRYRNAIETIAKDKGVDAVLVLLTPQAMSNIDSIAEVISDVYRKIDKPIFTSFMGGAMVESGRRILNKGGIPNYDYPERAVNAVEAMLKYNALKQSRKEADVIEYPVNKEKVKSIIDTSREKGEVNIPESMAIEILEAYGFGFPNRALATSAYDAAYIADKLGFPVVMKIASHDILHKSDVGGVIVDINNKQDVIKYYYDILSRAKRSVPFASIQGVAIQQMIKGGKEIIVGMSRDPQFGPLIMFGLGGIYVEVLKDVSFRIAPLNRTEAEHMVMEIQMYPLLTGVRGELPSDFESIHDSIIKMGQLASDFPEIVECDINPMKVFDSKKGGCVALDARITISHK